MDSELRETMTRFAYAAGLLAGALSRKDVRQEMEMRGAKKEEIANLQVALTIIVGKVLV